MKITATILIPGKVDISSLERYQEDNPVEELHFHATIGPDEFMVVDDKWCSLIAIQNAKDKGWITLTEFNPECVPPHGSNHTDGTDDIADLVGDSGSGGVHGLAPAPAAGDSAGGKFLKADGTWAVPPGGGGGGGTWGSIIGTLSDQTDLQAELDAKADISFVESEIECVKRYAFMISGG